jgi:dihydrofolate reductase
VTHDEEDTTMGKLINSISATVDGLTDVGAWFVAEGDHDRAALAVLADSAALLTGRTSYDGFAGYWPTAEGPWAETINPMRKYVASRTLQGRDPELPWNASVIQGDAVDGVARLKSEVDGDLFLTGCGELARTLIDAGLVDELQFWVHPAIGGAGGRPFDGATYDLRLREVTGFDSGVTLLRYEPRTAGAAS